MKEFKSEWAIVGTRDGLTRLYIGYSKEWCLENCNSWCNESILQNVEGVIHEGVIRFKGTKRGYRGFLSCEKYFDLSLPEVYEIDPEDFEIKESRFLFSKNSKKYIKFKDYKKCLDRRVDERKREVTTSMFKLNDVGV